MSAIVLKAQSSLRSWMFVYLALVATAVFTDTNAETSAPDRAQLSPVVFGEVKPALATEAIAKRSDI